MQLARGQECLHVPGHVQVYKPQHGEKEREREVQEVKKVRWEGEIQEVTKGQTAPHHNKHPAKCTSLDEKVMEIGKPSQIPRGY